jgi:Mg2+ and Co2+ transporter CorA
MAAPGELKRLTLTLIVSIIILDAVMIGGYYGLHVALRTEKTQQTYVAVWIVLTLAIVTTLMKRIRSARRRR